VIGGAIHRIYFLPERQWCQSYVHPTRLVWLHFRVICMPGCWISQLVIFEKIADTHQNSPPGFRSGWSHDPQRVPRTLIMCGISRLELCCLNLDILTSLTLDLDGIVQMNSGNNVTLYWLPGSGIIRKKSCLLKYHLAHSHCVKLRTVWRWGSQLFDHSISQQPSLFTRASWKAIILMLCILSVSA